MDQGSEARDQESAFNSQQVAILLFLSPGIGGDAFFRVVGGEGVSIEVRGHKRAHG